LFAVAYAKSLRNFWLSFFVSHLIHLGFLCWYLHELDQPLSPVTISLGLAVYIVIIAMGLADLVRPGKALKLTAGLHFIWLNLLATFAIAIVKHWSEGFRFHSALGIAILLTSAAIRFSSKESGRTAPEAVRR
jgi:hypothetical protein